MLSFTLSAVLYNDFDINLTHLSSPACTNSVTTAPCRVFYITLIAA